MLAGSAKKHAHRNVELAVCACLSLLAVVAVNVNLVPATPEEGLSPLVAAVGLLSHSFPNANNSFLLIVEWCGAFVLVWEGLRRTFDPPSFFVAALFSAAVVLGFSIQETGSLAMLSSGAVQIMKALVCAAGHLVLAYCLIRLVFAFFDASLKRTAPTHKTKERSILERHPFAVPFLAILLVWLPVIVGYAPGLFMGDTDDQLCMWLGLEFHKSSMVNLLSPDVTMTTHYPPIHTALFGSLLHVGIAITGSPNIGVFLYTIVQVFIALAGVSYAHSAAMRLGAVRGARLVVLGFIAFTPWFSNYAVLVTRDTIFTSMLLVFCMQLLTLAKEPASRSETKTWIILVVSGIFASLFRSGAILIVAVGLAVLVLYIIRQDPAPFSRKAAIGTSCIILALSLAVSNVLYPALAIAPGHINEMLSIPFQQTARYVHEHPNELEPWEKEAIDAVLVYEGLADRYDPMLSDPVKDYASVHRHNVTPEERSNYFRAYVSMGLKDPACYLFATMNNYYGYFYPAKEKPWFYSRDYSAERMVSATNLTGLDFHPVQQSLVDSLADIVTAYYQAFQAIPLVNLLMLSCTWVWALILATAYALRRKWAHAAPVFATLWVLTLIFLAGPCNGADYNRYVYPLAVVLPFLLIALPMKPSREGRRR